MSIILKFTLKNIKENKGRTILILVALILSTALFFGSIAASTTLEQLIIEQMRQYCGDANIVVNPGMKMTYRYFSPSILDDCKENFNYIVGLNGGSGEIKKDGETKNVDLQGIQLEDLNIMNPIEIEQQNDLYPFKGSKVIISNKTAKEYNYKIGDFFTLKVNGVPKWLTVVGISKTMGPFSGQSTTMIVPRDFLIQRARDKGKVTSLYIGLKNIEMQEQMVEDLSKKLPKFNVYETISRAQLKSETQEVTMVFLVLTMFVLILSMFIIYTAFKVITAERLPMIGTFRSIGATKKMTNRVLMFESVIYGIIGSIIGFILGVLILQLLIMQITPEGFKQVNVSFSPIQVLGTFLLGIGISCLSALKPIKNMSKLPIKDIILDNVEKKSIKKRYKAVLGILFISIGVTASLIAPKSLAIVTNIIAMVLLMPAIVLLVPILSNIFLDIFKKLFEVLFGNEGLLAVQNLRGNKHILNNIILLSIAISVVSMINIVCEGLGQSSLDYINKYNCDIQMLWPCDRMTESRLIQMDGVKDVYSSMYKYRVNVKSTEKEKYITTLEGVDKYKFLDYFNITFYGDKDKLMNDLDKDRNIIISSLYRDENNTMLGDTIELQTQYGYMPYKVVGFFNSNGNEAYVSKRYLKLDFKGAYNSLYIKTDKDPNLVVSDIQEKFKKRYPTVYSMEEDLKETMEGDAMILGIFKGFGVMALIIGVFGVFNNLVMSFMARKRSFAIMRSVGMNRGQNLKMIFVEALTSGLIGAIIGVTAGLLLVWMISRVVGGLGGTLGNYINVGSTDVIYPLVLGMIITIIASISPALKSSKFNIIDAIKYE